ncbi:MAG TPA: biotin--[acetyl-CoA-carboxylase] ligase [Phycisphaerae bacterium]|nr:biotin--[acetyl-CoA-carboxylase] ligase [Phycisphaerae bacterium]
MERGRLHLERIVSGLSLRRVGRATVPGPNVRILDSVSSTNDSAWARLNDPEADGLVILAEHQSRGRGRLGRDWLSPRGASILASVLLLEPGTGAADGPGVRGAQLGLAAAVACCDAVARATDVRIQIKWPNDLVYEGRKLGGILVESRTCGPEPTPAEATAPLATTAYVVGLGINCLQHRRHFPEELRDRATSLDLIAGGPIDRCALSRAVLVELDRWYADASACTGDVVRRAWLNRAAPLGQRVRLHHAGKVYTGHVIDVDPTASLVVQLDEGGRRLFDAASTTIAEE